MTSRACGEAIAAKDSCDAWTASGTAFTLGMALPARPAAEATLDAAPWLVEAPSMSGVLVAAIDTNNFPSRWGADQPFRSAAAIAPASILMLAPGAPAPARGIAWGNASAPCALTEGAGVFAGGALVGVVDAGGSPSCASIRIVTIWDVKPFVFQLTQTDTPSSDAHSGEPPVSVTEIYVREGRYASDTVDPLWYTFSAFLIFTLFLWGIMSCFDVPEPAPARPPPQRVRPPAPSGPPTGREGGIWYTITG